MTSFRAFALVALSLLAIPAWPQTQGKDYALLTPSQPAAGTSGKIEVIEFFSWGCPHCYALHPLLSQWSAQLPANAVLIKVPVAFGRREWGQLVRTFYALEAMGDLARLEAPLFEAIHRDGQPLYDEARITAFVAKQGVDAAKFRDAFNSFDISTKASRAEQLTRSYRISGVPALTVDGKYLALGHDNEEMLKVASQLLAKAQSERSAP